jgi:cobalt/nickel transport protein
MKKSPRAFLPLLLLLVFPLPADAHFGMVIPSLPTVTTTQDADITLTLKFWHPFTNQGMNLDRPAVFTVTADGATTDLLPSLKADSEQGLRVWKAAYAIKRPGLYVFSMEPVPYFEKEEDCFIIHYTKAYVDAFGDDEGWDKPLGLKTEIVPLVRPGGLYAGNAFQGQVLLDGKPVPHSEVEVEWYPGPALRGQAPSDSLITQTGKADAAGVFTYVAPREGWWGFAALNEAEKTLPFQGKEKSVELGAVLWVRFQPLLPAVPLP